MPPAPAPAQAPPSIDQLRATLASAPHHLPVKASYLQTLLTNVLNSPRPPIGPALIAALKFRVLASDVSACISALPQQCLPATSTAAKTEAAVVVQVMDVMDVTISALEALDAFEMAARGERAGGLRNEIVRVVPDEDGGQLGDAPDARRKKNSMHKLLLEDAAGRRMWGVEIAPIDSVKVGMGIGSKILLKGADVARGVVLMAPDTAVVLGGKVEAFHKAWIDGRKARLTAAVEGLRQGAGAA